jgi:hypothetical protein
MTQREADVTLCGLEIPMPGFAPADLGRPREVQQVSAVEIGEEESCAWITLNVAEGVEEPVAGIVRERQ